jgi:hypothetical protein
MPIIFDPSTQRIILDSAVVTATTIYSRWADWIATSDNSKYLPAFRTAGGDDLGGGLSIPPYYFLLNGWRVRPQETNHDLDLQGNLFVEGGGNPFVKTLGNFQVNVRSTVPVQAQGIATGGGGGGGSGATAAEIAAEVWSYLNRSLTVAPSSITTADIRTELAPELARIDREISSRVAAGDMIGANIIAVRGEQLTGRGTKDNPWRSA